MFNLVYKVQQFYATKSKGMEGRAALLLKMRDVIKIISAVENTRYKVIYLGWQPTKKKNLKANEILTTECIKRISRNNAGNIKKRISNHKFKT